MVNKQTSALELRAAEAEDRSRRHNVKFYDIEEQDKGYENCEAKIQDIVQKLKVGDVWIDRAHRLGKPDPKKNKKWPIIARFTYYKDKARVLDAIRKPEYSERGFGASEDYSKETYDHRRQLMDHLNEVKKLDTRITGHLSYKTLILKFNVNDKFIYSRVSLKDIEEYPHAWFLIDFQQTKRDALGDD